MIVRTLALLLCLASFHSTANTQWRLGLITPPPHRWTKTATEFAEQLAQQSKQHIQLSIFPSGQLGNEAQMLQLLQTGAIDFGFFTTSELANRLPAFAAFYTPYLANNARHAAQILEADAANNILNTTNELGLIGLGFGMAGMRQILVRSNVNNLADMRGMKVRVVPDAPLTDFWRYANTAPTPIPLSSLYDAFANGQIDAMHIDFENTLRLKLYQHADTIIHSNHMMFPMVALASAKAWSTMSDQNKQLVQQLLTPLLSSLRYAYADADREFLKILSQVDSADPLNIISADADFFSSAAQRWQKKWSTLSPYTQRLFHQANTITGQSQHD